MAGDASNSLGGGAADRPGRETGRTEASGGGDDPWRRIETEQADRDRASRAHDAAHDPSEEFEKSHLSLPERDRSPGRFTVDDFTPEQRADLEEAHERPLEEILASRDRAYEAEQARRAEAPPPPELEAYPELPDDDTANEIVRLYRDGHYTYDSATRRLELLGHQPKPIQQQEQPDQAEQADQGEPAHQADQDSPDPRDAGSSSGLGAPSDSGGGSAGADVADLSPSGSDQRELGHTNLAEQVRQVAASLRAGTLSSQEAADHLESLTGRSDQEQVPAGHQGEDLMGSGRTLDEISTYESPSDIREALLSGKSVGQVRRELIDQPDTPPANATTELVRDEGDLRFERGTPSETPLEPDDPEGLREALRTRENIEDAQQVLEHWGKWVEGFDRDDPTSASNRTPPDQSSQRATEQVIYATTPSDRILTMGEQQEGVDGVAALWTAPLVAYLLVDQTARWASAKIAEGRTTKGEPPDAGD